MVKGFTESLAVIIQIGLVGVVKNQYRTGHTEPPDFLLAQVQLCLKTSPLLQFEVTLVILIIELLVHIITYI